MKRSKTLKIMSNLDDVPFNVAPPKPEHEHIVGAKFRYSASNKNGLHIGTTLPSTLWQGHLWQRATSSMTMEHRQIQVFDVTGQIAFCLWDLWHQSITKLLLNKNCAQPAGKISMEVGLEVNKGTWHKSLCTSILNHWWSAADKNTGDLTHTKMWPPAWRC